MALAAVFLPWLVGFAVAFAEAVYLFLLRERAGIRPGTGLLLLCVPLLAVHIGSPLLFGRLLFDAAAPGLAARDPDLVSSYAESLVSLGVLSWWGQILCAFKVLGIATGRLYLPASSPEELAVSFIFPQFNLADPADDATPSSPKKAVALSRLCIRPLAAARTLAATFAAGVRAAVGSHETARALVLALVLGAAAAMSGGRATPMGVLFRGAGEMLFLYAFQNAYFLLNGAMAAYLLPPGRKIATGMNKPFDGQVQTVSAYWRRWNLTLATHLRACVHDPIVQGRLIAASPPHSISIANGRRVVPKTGEGDDAAATTPSPVPAAAQVTVKPAPGLLSWVAKLSTFVVSGALHELLVYAVTRRSDRVGNLLLFFTLNGLATIVEGAWPKAMQPPKAVGALLARSFLLLTHTVLGFPPGRAAALREAQLLLGMRTHGA